MDLFNPFLVKTYQDILDKNPDSKVFCPLAQIYRMKNETEKAKELCRRGIRHNPSYSAGYIVLARIHIEENDRDSALSVLNSARELSPENPKIYRLFGELYQKSNDIEKTLWAFKMVLFLRPWDKTARKIVRQLERSLFKSRPQTPPNPEEGLALEKGRMSAGRRKKVEQLQKFLSRIEKRLTAENP